MIGLLVALGGALGACSRYAIDVAARHRFDDERPLGVLAVNVAGSLLLGIAVGFAIDGRLSDDGLRVVGSGVLGGFTTFSTVAVDTVVMGETGVRTAAAYMVGSVVLGLAAAAAGMLLGGAF